LKEKLIIENFGPIRCVDLDLGRFNILIGEQATGKSTIAKLLAICRYYSYIRRELQYKKSLSNFSQGLDAWGLSGFVKRDSHIFYECQHYTLSVDQQKVVFSTTTKTDNNQDASDAQFVLEPKLEAKTPEFANLLLTDQEILSRPRNGPPSGLPSSFFENDVASVMDNPFYLPTERGLQSVFSLGKTGIQNLSDSLFNSLARLDQIGRAFTNETAIEPLNITYVNIRGSGYIKKAGDDTFYSLANGASGYQSTIPIVLATEYYLRMRGKAKTFIIEEPELNLFPNAQQKLMQYLVDSSVNGRNSILMTTQSPYILTSLNNMLYAYQTGRTHKFETVKIIEEKYWIDPESVSAYMLLPDGTYENIFDAEERMIKAEKIDQVSSILNDEFANLLNIEFERK
jgi:predicted ATP-dependent endonuclease of OLD family